jgi:sugar phosphate isomerase/epimerase
MTLTCSRRRFAAVTAAAFLTARQAFSATSNKERRFTMDLRCGSIGVRANQKEAIALAVGHGFESVNPESGYLAGLSAAQCSELKEEMREQNLAWGAAGLSVDFRTSDAAFRNSLLTLPRDAKAMRAAGVTRVGTWLRPYHDELTYVQNFRQHATRLRACCKILADHGLSFGMEYVGPKTLWASKLHPFIHTMAETMDLIEEIGLDNVGVVLDSWHWYTAHETVADLKQLSNSDIIACDLNDAPVGIAVDEQIDNQRELPAATGVIDLKSFLATLVEIGYDGPVRAEPFNAALNQMDNEQAVAATAAAMKKAFALI